MKFAALEMHPLWPRIKGFLHVEPYGKDTSRKKVRHRIEFQEMPRELADKAVEQKVPCINCGRSISVVRARHGEGSLYYSPACPQTESLSCSRGRAASDEYESVVLRFCQCRWCRPMWGPTVKETR